MIVCVCRAVSERAIRTARAQGADTLEAIAAATGAGAACGCCRGTIARILAEPCRPVPCAECPSRAPEGIPPRVAADRVKSP